MAEFGASMNLAAFSIRGDISLAFCSELTDRIIKTSGMTPAYAPALYSYPVEGKGGEGFTYFQPITESFICWDVYPRLKGGYLVICSCIDFNAQDLIDEIKKSAAIDEVVLTWLFLKE